MGDLLLWLGAVTCWVLAFSILAQRQRVLAHRVARLERDLIRALATRHHVTLCAPSDAAVVIEQARQLHRQRAGG